MEKEVERLLAEDGLAEQTTYSEVVSLFGFKTPSKHISGLHSSHSEASDSDYSTNIFEASTPAFDPGSPHPEEHDSGASDKNGGDDDDAFDAAFAAEIDQVDLDTAAYADEESHSSEEGDDDDDLLFGEDEEDETDDDEDEDEEAQAARRLLAEEIRDLEAAVEKKIAEIATVQNVLIKVGRNSSAAFCIN